MEFPGYVGLRPLYDAGQYFMVIPHPHDSFTIRVYKADGEIDEEFIASSSAERKARVQQLIGAGLSIQV